ncbi:MAG: mechanosensitive ion channel family protein [Xanthobacteraceae bacterium]
MNTTLNSIQDWSEAMLTSLAAAMALFFAAIPKILGFVVILIIGWIVAGLVARAMAAMLRRIRFNELSAQSGFSGFVQNMGMDTDASGAIALTAKWFIRLIALVVAFDALGLPAVSDVLRQLLLWIPNLVVGIVVLVIGGLAANGLANIIRGATAQAGLGNPDVLARIAKTAVWAFAIVIAVNQIGVAETLVNTLFMAVVGTAALALGLAFGLGGRETAAEILRRWYERSQTAQPRLERAAETAGRMAQQAASNPPATQQRGDQQR